MCDSRGDTYVSISSTFVEEFPHVTHSVSESVCEHVGGNTDKGEDGCANSRVGVYLDVPWASGKGVEGTEV